MKLFEPPRLLTSGDIPPVVPPIAMQCDCACPSSSFVMDDVTPKPGVALRRAKVYQAKLRDEQILMFNPLGGKTVAVLNESAVAFWETFAPSDSGRVTVPQLSGDGERRLLAKMVACGLLEARDAVPQVTPEQPGILEVWLHVTNQCNLRCDYCYVEKSPDRMGLDTGRAAVDSAFRSAMAGGFVGVKLKFAGGEATLVGGRVLELDEYARRRAEATGLEYQAVILSNGVAISDALVHEARSRGIVFMISLDGVGSSHDAQRRYLSGRGSAAQVVATLERLVRLGVTPFVSITVTHRNAGTLLETVRFLRAKEVPFNLNLVRDNERIADMEPLSVRDDELLREFDALCEWLERDPPRFSLLGMMVDRANFQQPHRRPCGAGHSYLVIDQRGQISKCHMEISQSVTDVTADDPLAVLREDRTGVQNPSVDEKEGCRMCDWRYWCAGGCPQLSYRAYHRYDIRSPYCNLYLAMYPRLLRLEGMRILSLADEHGEMHA